MNEDKTKNTERTPSREEVGCSVLLGKGDAERLVIEKEFLSDLLDELYELSGLMIHYKDDPRNGRGREYEALQIKIKRAQVYLKNTESFEVICHKCGVREGSNQVKGDF